MGAIYKRNEGGNFYVKYKDVNGEYKYKSAKTKNKTKAREFLVKVEKEVEKSRLGESEHSPHLVELLTEAVTLANEGKLTIDKTRSFLRKIHHYGSDEEFPEYTLKEWIESYRITFEQNVSDSTRKNNDTIVEQVEYYMGKDYNKDVTLIITKDLRNLVDAFKNHMSRGKKNKNSTINHKISYVKTIFKRAYDEGLIERDVSAPIQLLKTHDSDKRGVFTDEEIHKIISESESELSAITKVAVTTGLRLENVQLLRTEEVNLEKKFLLVTPVKQSAEITQPKKLNIPIVLQYEDFYRELVESSKGGFLFPTRAKQQKTNLTTAFSNNMKRLNIPKVVTNDSGEQFVRTFHSLRHTFNSNLSHEEVPIEIRKLITGHAEDHTNEIYTHHKMERVREALEKAKKY